MHQIFFYINEVLALIALQLGLTEQCICIIFLSSYLHVLFILPWDCRAFHHAGSGSSESSLGCLQCRVLHILLARIPRPNPKLLSLLPGALCTKLIIQLNVSLAVIGSLKFNELFWRLSVELPQRSSPDRL